MKFHLQRYRKPLAGFLNDFAEQYRNSPQDELEKMSEIFERTVENVASVYGNLAFRVFDANESFLTPFNTALFDAEMLSVSALPRFTRPVSQAQRAKFVGDLLTLFADDRFQKAISRATSDESQVAYRIESAAKVVGKHY